jgi:plastocyanin
MLALLGGLAILALGTALAAAQEPGSQAPGGSDSHLIVAERQAFDPAYVTVPAGTTITWVNRDRELHTVTSDVGLFNGELGPRGRFAFTFSEPGVYFFYCQPHDWMIGEVTVVAADQAVDGAVSAASAGLNQAGVDVSMLGYEFQPASITLPVGGFVSWTNFDSEQHTATSFDTGTWSTGVLSGGQSEAVQFLEAGTYAYLCEIHPSMTGEVVVT